MEKISVVIPNFNRTALLERAMKSVVQQSVFNCHDFGCEIIVIDDGSNNQLEIEVLIEKFNKNISNENVKIKLIKLEKNIGVSHARNVGIKASSGDWIAFLDSDDEWLPSKLERQFGLLTENKNYKIIHGEEIWIRNGVRVNQMKKHQKFGGFIFEKCLSLCLISPSAVIIHRDVFNDVGLFDENYIVCEDYELWLRITSLYEIGFIETPIINKYGGHDDQLSHKYFAMDYYRVRALDKILQIRELSAQHREMVREEIVRKGQILLNGYKKHSNMQHYNEIDEIIKKQMRHI